MPDTASLDLQALLGDRYRIEREIARGGMATVYLATDLRYDRNVALKVMHPGIALTLGRERFLREIRLTANLSHPNILTVHDSGEAGDYLWYVMPYVDGESLRARLDARGRFSADEAVRLSREAADAIGYAHTLGIIHRDIKPENILLSRDHAVIADFGIARAMDAARDERITNTGVALGTPGYMSPEQSLGEKVDARSDVWALGCVMYEMLSGKPPFGASGREAVTRALTERPDSLNRIRHDVPERLGQIIDKALDRDPEKRFPNAVELNRALAVFSTSESVNETPSWRKPSRVLLAAIALAIIVTSAVMISSRRSSGGAMMTAAPPPGDVRLSSPSPRQASRLSADSIARSLYSIAMIEQARVSAPSMARAITLYMRAIARDSSFAQAWTQLSAASQSAYVRAYEIPGIPRDSLRSLAFAASQRAIELHPGDAQSWLVRSRVSRIVDPLDNGPALFAIRKSLMLDSTSDATAWSDLGVLQEELLNDSASIAALIRSAAIDPSDFRTLAFIGQHYLWTDQPQLGEQWVDSAIKLNPAYQVGRYNAAMIDIAVGKPNDALRKLDVVMRLAKGREQVLPLAMLATAYGALGDRANARESINRALSLFDVRHPAVHEAAYLGTAYAAIGDTASAIRILSAYTPRGDLHYQLHLKRDPGLRWLRGKWGKGLLLPDPKRL